VFVEEARPCLYQEPDSGVRVQNYKFRMIINEKYDDEQWLVCPGVLQSTRKCVRMIRPSVSPEDLPTR